MADYDNTNTFVLFKNDKGDNPKRPDYTGTAVLGDGTEKAFAAWIRESKKDGKKFISGTISDPNPKAEPLKDDIPF